jgi:hypothetical protein
MQLGLIGIFRAGERIYPLEMIQLDSFVLTPGLRQMSESEQQAEYKRDFELDATTGSERDTKAKRALAEAHEVRKFEIGLYWQRATYFWAFIAVAFGGYFAVLTADRPADDEQRNFLAFVVGCVGLLLSWAWCLVNRGSKFWQENWENHVDLLEDRFTGPLHKTILYREANENWLDSIFTSPGQWSVTKINAWVSTFTVICWIAMVANVFPWRLVWMWIPAVKVNLPAGTDYVVVGVSCLLFMFFMCWGGKRFKKDYRLVRELRTTAIAKGARR